MSSQPTTTGSGLSTDHAATVTQDEPVPRFAYGTQPTNQNPEASSAATSKSPSDTGHDHGIFEEGFVKKKDGAAKESQESQESHDDDAEYDEEGRRIVYEDAEDERIAAELLTPNFGTATLMVEALGRDFAVADGQAVNGRLLEELIHGKCRVMILTGNAFKKETLKPMSESFIKAAMTVQSLTIRGIIANLSTNDAAETLVFLANLFAKASNLEAVDAGDNPCALDNDILIHLAPIFANCPVVRWNFEGSRIGSDMTNALAHKLLPNASVLRVLRLGLVEGDLMYYDVALAALLRSSPCLEVLSYQCSGPCREGMMTLLQGLVDMVNSWADAGSSLVELILGGLYFNLDSHLNSQLCSVLEHSPRLQVLALRNLGCIDRVPDDDVHPLQSILDALTDSRAALSSLDLGVNRLGTTGVEYLVHYLKASSTGGTLRRLNLEKCALGDDGVKVLFSEIPVACTALDTLVLRDNEITDIGAQVVVQNHIMTLKVLDIGGNNIHTVLPAIAHMYNPEV